jgi:DNA polymerase
LPAKAFLSTSIQVRNPSGLLFFICLLNPYVNTKSFLLKDQKVIMSNMTLKQELLRKLEKEIRENKKLPLIEANLVFGDGNIDCEVMFIGEAPGFHEDKQGKPFVGRAGQLLNQLLTEIGWKRENVYISNIVKRRPPENRDPLPEEIEAYKPYLAKQIEIIKPKVIATLGRFSMNYFLPLAKISNDHGKIFETKDFIIYPLYHPAAALRSTTVLEDLRRDFKKLPEILNPKPKKDPQSTKQKPEQSKMF